MQILRRAAVKAAGRGTIQLQEKHNEQGGKRLFKKKGYS